MSNPKNPILTAALMSLLPPLPAAAEARKDGKQLSPIVGARGQPLLSSAETSEQDAQELGPGAVAAIMADANARNEILGQIEPTPDANGVVQYLSAIDEMQMACEWLMHLSEEDAAAVLPILRTVKDSWYPTAPVSE